MLKSLKFHIIAISIICVLVVGLSQMMGSSHSATPQGPERGDRYVRVVSATWGLNCNPFIKEAKRARETSALPKDDKGNVIPQEPLKEMALDNILNSAKTLCDGKIACEVMATSDALGLDPMASCFKKLNLNYRCFELDRLRTTETNQGDMLKIDCAPPAATDAPAPAATQP